jgi:hypothetical protein
MNKNEPQMRVYHIPEHLRETIDKMRKKRGETIRNFLSSSVAEELPNLAKTLLGSGIEKFSKTRPARWPMEPETLKKLAYVSEQTGVPQNQLLLACITIASKRRRRRPSTLD